MNVRKVLITDYVHDRLISGMTELGFTVSYDQNFDPSKLENVVGELSGIVINSKIKMTRTIIESAPHLKFIGRLGSGLEIIDLEAAKEKDIAVFNTPSGNCDAVAEHAIGMLLMLNNNLMRADQQVRQKHWDREGNRGIELMGKTLGIIGLGHTGRSMARKLSGWALDIIYYDPYVLENPKDYDYLSKVSLETLCSEADIISLHVPLTEETKGMVNRELLTNLTKKPVLINTSRGKVVDTQALVYALEQRLIRGACLDVFENEKPHTFTSEEDQLYNRLYAFENVILSPHIAGWTHESLFKIADGLVEKIKKLDL